MKPYSLQHLADSTLIRELKDLVTQDHLTTAQLLAHLAEVEDRRLYLPASYPSMFMYCVRVLRMSEDMAFKRIRAARAGRRFPQIFTRLAEGGLHVSAVVLLAPHLQPKNAEELLAAAEHKTKAQIELLLAERFPRADVPTIIRPVAIEVAGELAARTVAQRANQLAPGPVDQHTLQFATQLAPARVDQHDTQVAPGPVDQHPLQIATQLAPEPVDQHATQLAPTRVGQYVPELATQVAPGPVVQSIASSTPTQIEPAVLRARITPISAGKFAMQLTIDQETQAQLVYAQALLGHAVPAGDVAQVLKRALNALVQQLEQKRFAKCTRSRSRSSSSDTRYVPAEIRRTVWQRDGGQCTFFSASGRRCEERTRLEFDHLDPVARGGQTLISKIKLKCRAHNQYAAECAFGTEFMRHKRQHARAASLESRAHARRA